MKWIPSFHQALFVMYIPLLVSSFIDRFQWLVYGSIGSMILMLIALVLTCCDAIYDGFPAFNSNKLHPLKADLYYITVTFSIIMYAFEGTYAILVQKEIRDQNLKNFYIPTRNVIGGAFEERLKEAGTFSI